MEIFLTQEEEAQIDGAKSLFYYPQEKYVYDQINDDILPKISNAHRNLFISSIFIELAREQSERRKYIVASFGIDLDKDQADTFILAMVLNPNLSPQQVLSENTDSKSTINANITSEVIEQINFYSIVNSQIKSYMSKVIIIEDLGSIYERIIKASSKVKEKFIVDMNNFVKQVGEVTDERVLTNINAPKSLVYDVQEMGLGPALDKTVSLFEEIQFLTKVQLIINAIAANEATPEKISDSELLTEVALWQYYKNPPQLLDLGTEPE